MSYSFTQHFTPVKITVTNIDHHNRPAGHDAVASQYLVRIDGEATRTMASWDCSRTFLLTEDPTEWIAQMVTAAMAEWFMDRPQYGQAHTLAARPNA